MNFSESISTCFTKYSDFTGRATRSEFWWFVLFTFLVTAGCNLVNNSGVLSGLFSLATLLPSLAVGARRLHDTNRSGWLQLLWFIPVIGWILLIIWDTQAGDSGTNRFDSPDLA